MKKSITLAVILSMAFGPFGMFYSTISGAIIMLVTNLIIFVSGFLTWGEGWKYYILSWLICVIWSAIAVSSYNKKTF